MILQEHQKRLIAGLLTLLIVMGLSRFAYTAIYPVMQSELGFTDQFAGFLASVNYAGYLLGSMFAGYYAWSGDRSIALKKILLINVLSIILMGATGFIWVWYVLRFLAGFTGGAAFVLISSITMDYLAAKDKGHLAGFFYMGVGTGIFLGGISVPFLSKSFGWQGTWYGVGLLAFLLSLAVFKWVEDEKFEIKIPDLPLSERNQRQISLPWLVVSYTSEGIGYIISATFLVAIVGNLPGLTDLSASFSWAFVGLAGAPSCILWMMLAGRFGRIRMLRLAFIIQIVGVAMPVIMPNNIGAFVGALLFGGTFMGITTLTISTAKILFPENSSRIIGQLTLFYALGQIIGPIIAGYLITSTGNYNSSLIFACIVLMVGVISLTIGTRRTKASTP